MTDFANPQEEIWAGPKGDAYVETYQLSPKQLDKKWVKAQTGVEKSEMNTLCFLPVPKDAKILEVGCNVGNQMALLNQQGWRNICGVELNKSAVVKARERGLTVVQGNALDLEQPDDSIDLVYTCWVLGHIAPPKNLADATDEIYRVSRKWISGCEPFFTGRKILNLRPDYLWRGDYCAYYLRRFPSLRLVNRYNYKNPRVPGWSTEMFLLEKF